MNTSQLSLLEDHIGDFAIGFGFQQCVHLGGVAEIGLGQVPKVVAGGNDMGGRLAGGLFHLLVMRYYKNLLDQAWEILS